MRTWGRRPSVNRLADPTPLPGEVRHCGMRPGGDVVELAEQSWMIDGTHEGLPVDGMGVIALTGPSWTVPVEAWLADRLADEIAAPPVGHPTAALSVTAADGTALVDLTVTADLRTIATAVRTALSDIAHREQ